VGARRNRIARYDLFFVVDNDDLRMQIFFMLDHHGAHDAGGFVDLSLHRHPRNHVPELHAPGSFGQNGHVIRIPLNEGVTLLHHLTVRDGNNRTNDYDVSL